MDLHLSDRLAFVSGSTKGIGFAIAQSLAREGARVIVNGRSEKSVAAALQEIRGALPAARLEGFAGDLSSAAAAEKLVGRFPQIDILVNNLGIFEPKPFEEISDDNWRRFFEVNVLSGVRLSRAYLPGMKQRNWGRIVFISSESGIQIPAEMIHYGMTKTAELAVCAAWPKRRRHGRHRERRAPRPNPFRRRGRLCRKVERRKTVRRVRTRILRKSPPHLAPQAFRHPRRSRQPRHLRLQSIVFRHQRSGR